MYKLILLWYYVLVFIAEVQSLASVSVSLTRRAIELSNKANNNPTFAVEACRLWNDILNRKTDDSIDDKTLPLLLGAMSSAHGLYASTLVRIGRDKEAIVEYEKSLNFLRKDGSLSKPPTKDEIDIRMGIAKSLQRMLKYKDAADSFLNVTTRLNQNKERSDWVETTSSYSIQSAALCYMRIGDLDSAISILENFDGYYDVESAGLNGALLLLQLYSASRAQKMKDSTRQKRVQKAYDLLNVALDKSTSPIYKWINLASYQSDYKTAPMFQCNDGDIYLSFAKVNNSPFDDYGLVTLDDKILLHNMIVDYSPDEGEEFWPQGYILPKQWDLFRDNCKHHMSNGTYMNTKMWILKERSGYGSHGNSIVSMGEVLSMYNAGKLDQDILCQKIIEPPMLINGRKFSLRIYVVYFPGGKRSIDSEKRMVAEVYISTEGLVKYAAEQYKDTITKGASSSLDDQHMTNSGRGDGRSSQQQTLQQLQIEFQANGLNYDQMWEQIESSVKIVMQTYITEPLLKDYQPFCTVPKILGFDYILDSTEQPYLLEVNRFPGLEPRSAMDSDVKHAVVYDAWIAASDRAGIPKECIRNLRPQNYNGFSLKRIDMT